MWLVVIFRVTAIQSHKLSNNNNSGVGQQFWSFHLRFISLSVFQNYVAVWIYCWYFLLFLFLATFLLCIEQLEFPGPQVIKVLFVCSFLYCRFTDIFWSKILRLHQQYCTQKLLSSRLKLFLSLKSCLIIDQQHEEGDE